MKAVLVTLLAVHATAAAKPRTVELTWRVYPPQHDKAPVELVATIAGKTRTLTLAPQFGALYPINQPICAHVQHTTQYPLARDELAKITFYEGGAGGYFVRRNGDVVAWDQGDGACIGKHHQLVACPRKVKTVAKLALPANARVHERVIEVDAKGVPRPFDCGN